MAGFMPKPCIAKMLATITTKNIDTQRCVWRIALFMKFSSSFARNNLLKLAEEHRPTLLGAAIGLWLIAAEAGLLHAQMRARARRRQRERHRGFRVEHRIV